MRQRRQQHGQLIDIFKLCGVDTWPHGDFERAGDASVAVDRVIGRPVLRLAGAVPAANSLRLPRQRGTRSLASPHRFLYLQLRLETGQTYAVHATYLTADRQQHRLSISNLFGGQEASRSRRAGGLQIFLPAAHDAWTLLAIDMHSVVSASAGGGGPCSSSAGAAGSLFARLCGLQLCANMIVRSAFTSDVVFDWTTLPPDQTFSASFDASEARVLWLPGPPAEGSAPLAAPRLQRPTSPRPAVPQTVAPSKQRQQQRKISNDAAEASCTTHPALRPSPIASLQRVAAYAGRYPGLLHWLPASSSATAGAPAQVVYAAGSLIVILQLPSRDSGGHQGSTQQPVQRHLRGHTKAVRALAVSADGTCLASVEDGQGAGIHVWDLGPELCVATLPGHAGGTACMDLSPNGGLLASAGMDSQGRQELAVWDVSACLAGAAGVCSGGSSGSGGSGAGRARLLARQASEYSMQAVRFVPHDLSRLVTCGKNSIRIHRLKDGHMRSVSVPMDGVPAERRPYSCGTLACADSRTVGEVFTCLAFEPPLRERPLAPRRLLAGTASGELAVGAALVAGIAGRDTVKVLHDGQMACERCHYWFHPVHPIETDQWPVAEARALRPMRHTNAGAVYSVDAEARAVRGVAQAHTAAVAALAAHAGFVATGSADRRLRLWGGDLREAYMEAEHEGAVTGVAVSPDGMHIVAGTDSGALSLMDIKATTYNTLLRSHTAAVHAVALLGQPPGDQQAGPRPQERQYCTAGADGTVRVWRGADHQQVLELCAPGEAVLSIACHPDKPEVACGFRSGALRIFDAASAALVQESGQHTGPVAQLAYVRHGRVLLSLGEDGCVCAYDVHRGYMPTTFVLAGFPLHATTMSASSDGRLLAVAALCMEPCCGSESGNSRTSPSTAQPVVALYDTLTLQPKLQVSLPCSSGASRVQLLPDGRHALALTSDGRLLGYRCTDGCLVLDVPCSLTGQCTAAVLDPTGTFLVAGTAASKLKVWCLHPLHRLALHGSSSGCAESEQPPGQAGVIRSLPCQEVEAPACSAVLGAAFLDSQQLLTVGSAGEVCCWGFHGEPCNAASASLEPTGVATCGTLVVRAARSVAAPAGACPAASPALHKVLACAAGQQQDQRLQRDVVADCTVKVPVLAAHAAGPVKRQGQEQQRPGSPAVLVNAGLDSPVPRPLPAALQKPLMPRPPSAPPALQKQIRVANSECDATAVAPCWRQSASLPSTPVRSRRSGKVPPIWERYKPAAEASLLITATPGKRCTQVVRKEKHLHVSSGRSSDGVGNAGDQQQQSDSIGGKVQRSAEWVEVESAGDRVPAYRPEQQLQLLPPAATIQRVVGFESAAGVSWLSEGCQELLCAAGNLLLVEDFASGHQRHLARLPRCVTALAASAGGYLAAAAVRPAAAEGSTADIHLVALRGNGANAELPVLSHHSLPVKAMAFSPEGSLLVSLSRTPDGAGSSLALWLVEDPTAAELVAGVELPEAVCSIAWEARAAGRPPTFYTAGTQGLVQWRLDPEALESTVVHMPATLRGVELTAVATCSATEDEEADQQAGAAGSLAHAVLGDGAGSGLCAVYVGDGQGRVWRLEVGHGQDVRQSALLAQVEGQGVSALCASGPHLLAAGTASGTVLLLGEEGWSDREASWRMLAGEQLDGPVTQLHLGAARREATAATASGTLWRLGPVCAAGGSPQPPQVLLCGQPCGLRGWHFAQGAHWRGAPPAAAVASSAGVAVWQLGSEEARGRAPLVEFSLVPDATHICLAHDASVCAAAYRDGSVCLYDAAEGRLRWRAAGTPSQGPIAAMAIVQRLRGCKVMVAYRSGALVVLDGGSGQVAHRTLQFAVQQDSGRLCPSNFPVTSLVVHPADSAVFALCGQGEVLVCKAAWTKNGAVTPLGRLSFGPAEGPADEAALAAAPQQATPAQAVRAAFSHTHPCHLYCTNPTAPGHVLLFDYTAQAVVKTLMAPAAGGANVTALALHPDEALLAAGTSSGSVLLLRLETESWAELAAHADGGPVVGLDFSACGQRLFSAAEGSCDTFSWALALHK